MVSKEQCINGFKGFMHCSQQVLGAQAEKLGFDRDTAVRMAAPFGGGMRRGEACGAVIGALMAVGLKCGHSRHGDEEGNRAMTEKAEEFTKKFVEQNGSIVCRDLLGYDFSKDGEREKAFESGKVFDVCPLLVQSALGILDEIL